MESFVHLHVHSYYSILDGQASIQSLVDKAYKCGMRAIALTDHGNMYGIKDFFDYVEKKNKKLIAETSEKLEELKRNDQPDASKIAQLEQELEEKKAHPFKPIIGCEAYVARNGRHQKAGKDDLSGYHLVLLAKNKKGYHNLIKLVSLGFIEGFYGRPRIDKALLEKYHEGLIVASACLGGEIPRLIAAGRIDDAEKAVCWYKNLFGDDYYLELQRHETYDPTAAQDVYPKQVEVNKVMIQLAEKHQIKLIATNDVHFANQEDAEAHDRLICLVTNADIDDPTRMRYTKQEWLKTPDEMRSIFPDMHHALENTKEIADKVEFYDINSKPIMPTFPLPEGYTNDDDYLKYLTYQGAKKRYGETLTPEIQERIDFELNVIKNMGFPGYFLIVQDFIRAARENGTSIGPGRGSAAGSVVAYCLKITDIDPIKYDLLFERFLNPDRISMPDIDIDFDDDGRGDVLRWVMEKYGKEKVAHIVTFGTMAAKSSIKDVARIQKLPLTESNRLAKLVPDKIPEKKLTLKNAIDYVPELKTAVESSDPLVRETLKYAQMLEGTIRNTGVHACGVIIGRDDLTNYIPIAVTEDKESGEKVIVSQYEGTKIEDVGMLKMDFLGLKTLSIIKDAIENVKNTTGKTIDFSNMESIIYDKKTYELYSAGNTVGTFQFESAGMQKHLKELQPTVFNDLIAMNALYRPGPMDSIPSFIARKHGREKIGYDLPEMERYLKDTYGITVYQEQVMLLSRQLANFTRGESDNLRKAMGKKLKDKMDELKSKFIAGAKANGYATQICEKIWADWEKFASYGFNKCHAACYTWVAFQTAYLKANYPSEYMAALLSRNLSNITEITKFMDECKRMNIQVLGPDVNESLFKFSVNKNADIRFGLGAIKGVGENAVEAIISERKKNGSFKGIFDFVERVNLAACNKRNIEAMAIGGAFDNFPELKREQYFAQVKDETYADVLIRYGNKFQQDKRENMHSLFGGENCISVVHPSVPPLQEWSDIERLNKERELVGIYLSSHPLDKYYVALTYGCNTQMIDFEEPKNLYNKNLTFGGIVTSVRLGKTKTGKDYAFAKVEDYSGSWEVPFFGDKYTQFRNYLYQGYLLSFKGKYQPRYFYKKEQDKKTEPELELAVTSIKMLDEVHEKMIDKITLTIPLKSIKSQLIDELSTLFEEKGNASLCFRITDLKTSMKVHLLSRAKKVRTTKEIIEYLNERADIAFSVN
ncbi:MAG: DNA polymerase III subunit alpha [Bacteroidales bacterium]|nr:DNA polymerase III subunit alpha [Bacteroidales bacterium]